MLPENEPKSPLCPRGLYFFVRKVMHTPASGVLDLTSGHRQGDVYSLLNRLLPLAYP
jgi:hypothetical protein